MEYFNYYEYQAPVQALLFSVAPSYKNICIQLLAPRADKRSRIFFLPLDFPQHQSWSIKYLYLQTVNKKGCLKKKIHFETNSVLKFVQRHLKYKYLNNLIFFWILLKKEKINKKWIF